MTPNIKTLMLRLPKDLWKYLKIQAANEEVSLNALIIDKLDNSKNFSKKVELQETK